MHTIGLAHRRLIFDRDQHGLARAHVGHAVGEQVGALLFHKARLAPFGRGLFIDCPSGFAAFDSARDHAVTDHHVQAVDRAVGRQRIEIAPGHPV